MNRPSRTRKLLWPAVFLALAGILGSCGGGSDSTPSPSSTPSPTPLIITPGPTATPPATEYRLVYRETAPTQDIIWSISPTDMNTKTQLAVIAHREGFPIRASISPDATFIAYLSQPEFALSADSSQAEVFVIDLKEPGEPVKVADFVDYNFVPLWSPDSGLIYMRRYAGAEFLNATQTIIRARIKHGPDAIARTPTPTPTPEPGIEPWPGPDPTVLKATVANVLRWTPLGFTVDSKSVVFLEEEGGTNGATLAGVYAPAMTAEVDKLYASAEAAWYAAQRANKQAFDDAAANGQPPPAETVTPAPTPAPSARFVVELSQQAISGASLSPDMRSLAYLNQTISAEGEFVNAIYIADLVNAATTPLPISALSPGVYAQPCWYPDGRLTVSVIPAAGGPGQMVIMKPGQSSVTLLSQPVSGFDVPWGWAPDGSWLAALHWSGRSLADQGDGRLDLISANGHRITLLEGAESASQYAVLGWMQPVPAEPAQ